MDRLVRARVLLAEATALGVTIDDLKSAAVTQGQNQSKPVVTGRLLDSLVQLLLAALRQIS